MEFRGSFVIFVAVLVSAVSADRAVVFPEIARERAASRIVSGWEAADGQIPFQISLRMVSPLGAVSSCGGSVIHPEWGLTAAHCTAGRLTMVIRAGVVNLTRPDAIFETTTYFNHPLYDNSRPSVVQPHDIGLLQFHRTLQFSDTLQPVRLQRSASRDANYDGVQLVASGWGRTWTDGTTPENLNWVFLRGDSNEVCFTRYGGSSIIVPSTICASGYNETSQSTCQGDSGGPLTVIDDDGKISQIGVTSFVSATGCHTDFPAGFIRSGHYHEWFEEVTGVNFNWEYEAPEPESSESKESGEPEESGESKESEESKESDESKDSSESRESSEEAEYRVHVVSADTAVVFPEIARERAASRIVSGWEAADGQIPFQISLRMVSPLGAVSSCGGSVIHPEWGLTAAHCTAGRLTMVIRVGVVNLTRPDAIFETTTYFNHPLYDNSRPSVVQPHDIGLLQFHRTLQFSDTLQPVRLQRSASKDANYDGVQLVASGWGRNWTEGTTPENLNWVFLRGDSNEECYAQYGGYGIIVPSTICASGYNVTSQSTCQGDSGGPLTVIDDDGLISQIGVTSFVSSTGCHTDFPAGFIRAGHYHEWYEEVTGVNFNWEYEAPELESSESNESGEPEESGESKECGESKESDESKDSSESRESSEEADFRVHVVNN